MNLLVVGATGHVGRLVTQQAHSRGHSVTAFVRTPSLATKDRLKIVVGDPRRIEDLLAALPGHDAVISCLGNPAATDRRLVTESATAMLAAMGKLNMKRYVILSGVCFSRV